MEVVNLRKAGCFGVAVTIGPNHQAWGARLGLIPERGHGPPNEGVPSIDGT